MMKYLLALVSILFLISFFVFTAPAGSDQSESDSRTGGTAPEIKTPDWECPIAAGIWYPTDGPVPENPVRYYRIRCWPGCHSGSSLGLYPGRKLEDKPIFPTSTVN